MVCVGCVNNLQLRCLWNTLITVVFLQIIAPLLIVTSLAAVPPNRRRRIPITRTEWATLNPYGSDPSEYPPEERANIERLQEQWERFFDYLPWLKGSPGPPGPSAPFPYEEVFLNDAKLLAIILTVFLFTP